MSEDGLLTLLIVCGVVGGLIYARLFWKEMSRARLTARAEGRLGWARAFRHGTRLGAVASAYVLVLVGPQILLRGESPHWMLLLAAIAFALQTLWMLYQELWWMIRS